MAIDCDQMLERIRATPFLVIDHATGDARLAAGNDILPLLGDKTHLLMHLEKAFHNLELLTAQREFSLHDVASVAGVEYGTAHQWLKQRLITASIRKPSGAGRGRGPIFSFADAFTAGVIGSLRRQGVGVEIMRQIAPLLCGATAESN